MRDKISRQNIAKLPKSPKSKSKQMMWDTTVPCFGCYKSTKGRVSFIYQYRMPGNPDRTIRSTLLGYMGEITPEQARALASELAMKRRTGIDPVLERMEAAAAEAAKTDLVLANYVEGYLERRIAKGKPHNATQTAIIRRDVVGLLGDKRIDRLTRPEVEAFGATLYARAPSAMRTGLVYLQAILNEAKDRDVISKAPTDRFEIPKSGKRSRRLRPDELKRFLESAHDIGDCRGDVLEMLVRTAKRKDEVRRMVWEEIDLSQAVWNLPDERSKNRKPYVIRLPRQVVALLERTQPDPRLRTGFVFSLNGGKTPPEITSQVKDVLDANMHRRVELANERDGTALSVGHFTVHDLRTAVASRMQEAPLGVPKDVIDAVLLHSGGGGVIDVYATSRLEAEAGDALQRWNDWLDASMAEPDAFPGGRDLPRIKEGEQQRRLVDFRKGWPERADQKRARERREGDETGGHAPRGRKARAERRRKKAGGG